MVLRRVMLGILLTAVFALLAQQAPPAAKPKPKAAAKTKTKTKALSPEETAARRLLNAMTLRERVAQLVIAEANGDVYSTQSEDYERYRHWVADLKIGGIIVINASEFGTVRYANPYAMATFLNQMQRLSKTPLLIASDFERAASMRVTGGTAFPHNMAYGAAGDIEASRFEGLIAAREARALGVHWVLAPVADVNNNPANPIINLRSYGEDPALVAEHVAAFIEGAHAEPANKVLVSVKHFPGHGDTDIDSHLGLPLLSFGRERLDMIELIPFRRAIAAGADSVMTAHMAMPSIDPSGVPATVSPAVLTQLLRDDLQFNKLIVTDAMNMAGLAQLFDSGEGSVRSLLAGADVLLMPPDPAKAINAVVAAVNSGRIKKARIDESALRILRAKVSLGLDKKKLTDLNAIADVMQSQEAADAAQSIADRAVTLLRNQGSLLPLRRDTRACLVVMNSLRISTQGQRLIQAWRARAPQGRVLTIDTTMPLPALNAVLEQEPCPAVVLASFAGITSNLRDVATFLEQITASQTPVALVSFNDPYAGQKYPQATAYMTTFSSAPPSEVAAAKALFGEMPITGRTPVTIPEIAALGDGIQLPSQRAAQ